ncbi:PTS sugar transporter subunit IIB [Erysipelothrix sp. HDW6C]|uniref:PTS sugar transporter subunit IIB n=1 Tax=Erysipelothrix sp. HDW6C TaxID=2714930 RepID=UPI00140AAE7D|nr:PTS sugar transporter subunit IIB [Erysipelothrix sp. HDW6C]QIK69435.1 PTS sugar transporter subunit IIB [Erysipelothrix sp. HDW6C]
MSTKVKLARIDKRLLHATVAVNWAPFVNANYAIVVDPKYVGDPFIENVMQLCLPKSMKVKIFNVDQLLGFVNEHTYETRNVMLIFKDLATALEAIKAGLVLKEIQLPYPASRMMIKRLPDYFNENEIETIRAIQTQETRLYFQTAPLDTKEYSIFTKK